MSSPRVSIILNSYNQAPYLADTIESVIAQTFTDWELLYIDNGSTDESPAIARRYAQKDARIALHLHAENKSLSQRQNEGVALARGEFISFLYSDDLYLPHKLTHQLKLFEALPAGYAVVYAPPRGWNVITGARWVHQSLGRSGNILRSILTEHQRGSIDMLSPLTRTPALRRYPFFEDLFAEGEAVFHRIAMTGKFHYDPEPVVVLREHDRNIGKAIRRNHENYLKVVERMVAHPDFPSEARSLVEPFVAELERNVAWQLLRLNDADVTWARATLIESMRRDPMHALHPRAVLGLGLSLLSPTARSLANRLGFALRGHAANLILRSDYR